MDVLNARDARAWIEGFHAEIRRRHQELTDLDRRAGDGDFGTNMLSALRRAAAELEAVRADTVAAVFTALSDGFLNTGGTSGPLFGMWFRAFAGATADGPTTGDLALAARNGLDTVRRLGHAEVGHKTMVDAMAPAAEALTAAAADGEHPYAALALAAEAARAGARSTESLTARRGRASYVGEHAAGVLDPGAHTVAVFFECAPVRAQLAGEAV